MPFPLFDKTPGHSKRARVTCRYKCGDACYHEPANTSENEYFGDIVTAISRRNMLKGAGAAVVVVGAGSVLAACGDDDTAAAGSSTTTPSGTGGTESVAGLNFTAVAPNKEDALVVAEGYEHAVVVRWGDPIIKGAPQFDIKKQTADAQRGQWGFNNDYSALLPIEGKPGSFLLVGNHEYTSEVYMHSGFKDGDQETKEQTDIAIAAHGLGIVEVKGESGSGKLSVVIGDTNRRITADTPFELRGPARGSAFVKTTDDPAGEKILGTFANCSGGVTPWGTILSGEENFNNYFMNTSKVTDKTVAERLDRYGFADDEVYHKWGTYYPRFDLAKEPNEANRFGWVVEVNPHDPTSTPIKHSALGRNKHEAATIWTADDGTVVAYSGDDQKFEYMYKFIAAKKKVDGTSADAMAHNLSILDSGTLYVAKFTGGDDPSAITGDGKLPAAGKFAGKGEWIPLLETGEDGKATSKVDGFTPEEVAVFTRLAADKAGATKMDRPEDFEPNPKTGKLYCALTNNSDRGVVKGDKVYAKADEANPRNENKNGQIIEITDNHTGTDFTWELLLVCGDPAAADTYFGGFDKTKVSPISCPDNVAFDPHGNLWISTDGNALDNNDGLFAVSLDGATRGETKQFLTVPLGAETCGPIVTEDRVLVSVQHPGETDDATVDNPSSHWPDGGSSAPRPAVVVVWKPNGKIGV